MAKKARKRASFLPWEMTDFTLGKNSTAHKGNVLSKELTELKNARPLARGGFSKRSGNDVVKNFGTTPITRMFELNGVKYICQGTSLIKYSDGTIIKNDFANTEFDIVVYAKKAYMVNGDEFYSFDGAIVSAVVAGTNDAFIANVRKCKYIERRGSRFYAAGDPDNPDKMYVSEPKDPTVWQYSVTTKRAVTGLKEFHRAMLAFQEEEFIQQWTGWDPATDVEFSDVASHKGALANRAIVGIENYLGYLANDGYYILLGTDQNNINSVNVSKSILPDIKQLTNLDKACAIYHEGYLYIACCNDGTGVNNLLLVANVSMKYLNEFGEIQFPWAIDEGVKISDFFKEDRDLYMTSAEDGNVYKLNTAIYLDKRTTVTGEETGLLANDAEHTFVHGDLDSVYEEISVQKSTDNVVWTDAIKNTDYELIETTSPIKLKNISGGDLYFKIDYKHGYPVRMEVKTKELTIGKRFMEVKHSNIFVAARQYTRSTTCNLSVRVDRIKQEFILNFNESVISGVTVLGEGAILGWLDDIVQEVYEYEPTIGNHVEFTFKNEKNEPCTIYGVGGLYKPMNYKGTKFGVSVVS
jgi:hypothetical protein